MTTLGIASQTPLLQFRDPSFKEYPLVDISTLRENTDFRFSPGGVSRMLFPLLGELRRRGIIQDAEWVALNPNAPAKVCMDGLTLHHVALPPEKLKGYGTTKERIWRLFHSMEPAGSPPDFLQDEYADYTYLNRVFSEEIHDLEEHVDLDGYYVHDFQLLPLGHMLESSKPKLFRWHIPFMVEELPEAWHGALLRYLSSYDAVVVSCRRYLKGLRLLGFNGPAYHLFPYVDPKKYPSPSQGEVAALRGRLGVKEGDRVILTVARLDPMKAQDVAIRALKRVAARVPEAKLVLVGDGSFSGSKGGIGLPKAELWLQYLRKVATEIGVLDRVAFAGYLDERDLPAAYAMSEAFVLPSIREGFGLVVVEAWLYKKPAIVSSYAGVSDLISEGRNGLTFDPMDEDILAKKILSVFKDEDFARRLGSSGFRSSRRCHLEAGVDREAEILKKYMGGESNGPD